MTDALRWGILGTGWIAEMQTSDLQLTGHPVTAVGSRTDESAQKFAATFGIPRSHGSYEALVADPDVDVIYVATPHPFHAEHAKLALNAGKHVLVEKPFTINAAEAQEVVDLATSKNLVVLEAMWTRWLPHMIRIREIIAAGTLGEVRAVFADHTQSLSLVPTHRMQAPELGGGALLDLGIYPISFAWDVFGKPEKIVAMSSPTATGVDRQTAILFGYGDGAQAVMQTELDAFGPNVAVVLGTKGRIDIDGVWYTPTSFRVIDSDGVVTETYESSVEGRGMQFQAAALEALVAAGSLEGAELPPSESVAIMASLDEIRAQIGLRYPSES